MFLNIHMQPQIVNYGRDFSLCSLFYFAAPPSVSNVQIVGEIIEECTLRGMGNYFGGREGPSQFKWLRENNETGLVFYFLYHYIVLRISEH